MSDITVIVPVSPIPSHPSTRIVETAINSVREQLKDSHVDITCDVGTCAEVTHRLGQLSQIWGNCTIFRPNEKHPHQSGMLSAPLDYISAPLLLYWESDWELLPDVPWPQLSDLILSGEFNSIKLHANPRVSPYHEHLMGQRVICQQGKVFDCYQDNLPGPAVPIIKTYQWSQNPHLASAEFYRSKILPLCEGKCDFIENVVHGVVAHSLWSEFKTGIYNPPTGDMMRVRHLDGRGTPA